MFARHDTETHGLSQTKRSSLKIDNGKRMKRGKISGSVSKTRETLSARGGENRLSLASENCGSLSTSVSTSLESPAGTTFVSSCVSNFDSPDQYFNAPEYSRLPGSDECTNEIEEMLPGLETLNAAYANFAQEPPENAVNLLDRTDQGCQDANYFSSVTMPLCDSGARHEAYLQALAPLLPYLRPPLTVSRACDLLEYYFRTASSTRMEPLSPYILANVLRKNSLFRRYQPRRCSPALLASMLCISAKTSDAAFLISPSSRDEIFQSLWKLTLSLLGVYTKSLCPIEDSDSKWSIQEPVMGPECGFFANVTIDDVEVYVNLGSLSSATEAKASSMRFWSAAWALAKELRLGSEWTQIEEAYLLGSSAHVEEPGHFGSPANFVLEERKEERRRLWWLLFMVDRHLGLCYNRTLAIRDSECEGLLQPAPDTIWQAGEAYAGFSGTRESGTSLGNITHDTFGFFLPLMIILGDIVRLNQLRNHRVFGKDDSLQETCKAAVVEQLREYERKLGDFQAQCRDRVYVRQCGVEVGCGADDAHKDQHLHGRRVSAYGAYIMHVLHILLPGKWDPLTLLMDEDLWSLSQSYQDTMSHALSALKFLKDILFLDPSVSLIPHFFGVYLLQGSLIMLLRCEKSSKENDKELIQLCEMIVHAHEAATITLDTNYQKAFRNAMISVLNQMKYRSCVPVTAPARRRGLLSPYQWTSRGTGLAL